VCSLHHNAMKPKGQTSIACGSCTFLMYMYCRVVAWEIESHGIRSVPAAVLKPLEA
jgi:hypothetical protein